MYSLVWRRPMLVFKSKERIPTSVTFHPLRLMLIADSCYFFIEVSLGTRRNWRVRCQLGQMSKYIVTSVVLANAG